MNNSKKIKTYHYHEEWEHDYFFIMIKNKCCLICNNSISLPKKGNLERHFKTVHSKYEINYQPKSDLRKAKITELKKH